MYYSRFNYMYYENEQDILKHLILQNYLYKKGFLDWKVKEKKVEIIPSIWVTKKIFTIKCLPNSYYKTVQCTVFEINEKPINGELFTIENYVKECFSKHNIITEEGKQLLSHFQKFSTIEELQNNLFIFEKTLDK